MGVFSQVCKSGDSFEGMTPPETRRCEACNGDGQIETGIVLFDGELATEECSNCGGTGRIPK